jgi:hypothetical protein
MMSPTEIPTAGKATMIPILPSKGGREVPEVRAYADYTTNFDYIVEVDGVRVGRFTQYNQDSAYLAARLANQYRLTILDNDGRRT